MSNFSVSINLLLDEDMLLFKNGLLLTPRIDFLFEKENRSIYEETCLIFKKELEEGDVLAIRSSGGNYWFIFKDGELLDISSDKPGYNGSTWR